MLLFSVLASVVEIMLLNDLKYNKIFKLSIVVRVNNYVSMQYI